MSFSSFFSYKNNTFYINRYYIYENFGIGLTDSLAVNTETAEEVLRNINPETEYTPPESMAQSGFVHLS